MAGSRRARGAATARALGTEHQGSPWALTPPRCELAHRHARTARPAAATGHHSLPHILHDLSLPRGESLVGSHKPAGTRKPGREPVSEWKEVIGVPAAPGDKKWVRRHPNRRGVPPWALGARPGAERAPTKCQCRGNEHAGEQSHLLPPPGETLPAPGLPHKGGKLSLAPAIGTALPQQHCYQQAPPSLTPPRQHITQHQHCRRTAPPLSVPHTQIPPSCAPLPPSPLPATPPTSPAHQPTPAPTQNRPAPAPTACLPPPAGRAPAPREPPGSPP